MTITQKFTKVFFLEIYVKVPHEIPSVSYKAKLENFTEISVFFSPTIFFQKR